MSSDSATTGQWRSTASVAVPAAPAAAASASACGAARANCRCKATWGPSPCSRGGDGTGKA